MKVLHICITDEGGAGLCCRRIHHAVKAAGVDSHVLSLLKFSDDDDVTPAPRGWRWAVMGAANKALEALHLPLTDKLRVKRLAKRNGATLTLPVTAFKTLHRHPLVEQADLIHLHGVAGLVDYPSFFGHVAKPIVWTQHDEILFSGLSHFARTRAAGGRLEDKYYSLKLRAVHSARRLGVVFLSVMAHAKFSGHEMVAGRPMTIINNPVDTAEFRPVPRHEARRRLGIEANAQVFVFVAADISNPWKGLATLCEAVERLALPRPVVLAVGGNPSGRRWPAFVRATGPMRGGEELSVAYSAADYFVSPSLQEAFSQTPIEAMACGTPAVLTPVSGTQELITLANGVRCQGFDAQALADGMRAAMGRTYDAAAIRRDMQARFAPDVIARKYIKFYGEMTASDNQPQANRAE